MLRAQCNLNRRAVAPRGSRISPHTSSAIRHTLAPLAGSDPTLDLTLDGTPSVIPAARHLRADRAAVLAMQSRRLWLVLPQTIPGSVWMDVFVNELGIAYWAEGEKVDDAMSRVAPSPCHGMHIIIKVGVLGARWSWRAKTPEPCNHTRYREDGNDHQGPAWYRIRNGDEVADVSNTRPDRHDGRVHPIANDWNGGRNSHGDDGDDFDVAATRKLTGRLFPSLTTRAPFP
jgi:hypothetical protein